MVVVKLYGVLESVAQRTTRLHVRGYDEAIRAIMANFPRLRETIRDLRVSILINGKPLTFEDCLRPFRADRIDIMPIVGGTGPAVMIVVGAAMAYGASAIVSELFLAGVLSLAMTVAVETFMINFGISLALGGLSQLLFKPPGLAGGGDRPSDAPSYMFNGAVNTISQGNVVPVGFGRMRVGSQVIGANIQTFDIPIAANVTTAKAAEPPPAPVTNVPISYNTEIA